MSSRSRAALVLVLPMLALPLFEGSERRARRSQQPNPSADPEEVPAATPDSPDAGPGSPQSCRPCHPLIYDRWSRGMHRYSFEDPIFQTAYAQVYTESAGQAASTCLRCHAPSAFMAGDLEVRDPVHRLGVQCGFCHSVEAVDPGHPTAAFRLRPGDALASPRPVAASPEEHGLWHQPLLRSAEFCAGCHEYVVEGGAHLVSTWSEWKASPYATEGKTCQVCHMPTLERVALKDGTPRELNDHNLSGGHSSVQVRKAGKVEVVKVERRGGELLVHATVENTGSGHDLPTGIPSRRLVLQVEIFSGQRFVDRDHRDYVKVIGDAEGRTLTQDADIKWHGRKILSDNRLRPREVRTEVFRFRVERDADYEVVARLTYTYSPLLPKPEPIQIVIGEQRKHAAAGR